MAICLYILLVQTGKHNKRMRDYIHGFLYDDAMVCKRSMQYTVIRSSSSSDVSKAEYNVVLNVKGYLFFHSSIRKEIDGIR